MQKKNIGNIVIVALVIINIALWLIFPPSLDSRHMSTREMISGILGSSALILLASALILVARASVLEPYFGGLDRMYCWHRRFMIVSLIVFLGHLLARPGNPVDTGLLPAWIFFAVLSLHVMLAMAPRIPVLRNIIRLPYSVWRMQHKVFGALLPIGMAFNVLGNSPIGRSIIVSAYVGAVTLAGIAAILYKVPLYGLLKRMYRFVVEAPRKLNDTTVQVTLKPVREKLAFTAGQFIFIRFEGDRVPAEPHPFTVSSPSRRTICV